MLVLVIFPSLLLLELLIVIYFTLLLSYYVLRTFNIWLYSHLNLFEIDKLFFS
jgi:hypothetical protein